MLRRAAQRNIANSGRVASEGEIKQWIRENREAQIRAFQARNSPPKPSSAESSSPSSSGGAGEQGASKDT